MSNIFNRWIQKKPEETFLESSAVMDLTELWLRGYSANTQRSYRSLLREWALFVGDLGAATRKHAMRWVIEQREKQGQKGRRAGVSDKITIATIHRKVVILRSFYKFLEGEGVGNGAKIFEFPIQQPESKPTKRPTEPIPMDKVNRLLTIPSEFTKEGQRDRAIIAIMLFTGCRRSEIRDMSVDNFQIRPDGLGEVVSIHTKGGDPLVRVLPKEATDTVALYRSVRLAEGASGTDPMFPTYRGENGTTSRLGSKWLYRRFKQWCKAAGIDAKHLSPHSARVTVVTKLLEEGFDYGAVATVTGHKSIELVRRYDARYRKLADSPALKLKY